MEQIRDFFDFTFMDTPILAFCGGVFLLYYFIAGLTRRERLLPPLFDIEDILKWQFIVIIESLKQRKKPSEERIWNYLIDECKAQIENWDYWNPNLDYSKPNDKMLKKAIVMEFNKILGKADFYDPEIFKDIQLSQQNKQLLDKGLINLNIREIRKFNRELFEAVYPKEIVRISDYKKPKHGCVVLFIPVLLILQFMVLAYPQNYRSKQLGRLVQCQSNLKNIGTALEMYSTDNEGQFPPNLKLLTQGYLKTIPTCASVGEDTYSESYEVYNSPIKTDLPQKQGAKNP